MDYLVRFSIGFDTNIACFSSKEKAIKFAETFIAAFPEPMFGKDYVKARIMTVDCHDSIFLSADPDLKPKNY